jgi:hypothetical protein
MNGLDLARAFDYRMEMQATGAPRFLGPPPPTRSRNEWSTPKRSS